MVFCARALGLCALLSFTSATALADSASLTEAIEARVGTLVGSGELRLQSEDIASVAVIADFYTRRNFTPAWNDPAKAAALLRAVRDSVDDGLDPADYHYSLLARVSSLPASSATTSFERADFDVLMTDALVRLGYHLWFGKVDPERFDPKWNMSRTLPNLDPAAAIEAVLAAPDLYAALEQEKPAHALYQGLKRELARHRRISMSGGWPHVAAGPKLELGVADARVPTLRQRLVASGDLDSAYVSSLSDADITFDMLVAEGLKRFQSRMGLTADGVLGPGTLRELNVSVEDRILQLRVNLDRGRVLLFDLPQQFVVVNVAGAHVYYIRGNDVVFSARAQVGKPYRETPEYRSDITYLVFNPTWTVPPGIIEKDILPAARRDPASITRKGLKVITSSGTVLNPASIDWSRYKSGHIPYTLRQEPGPDNALGRVKFMFPNPYSVYLHDTPSRALFDNESRTTSSGCVRVERPLELARLLLDDAAKWDDAGIQRAIAAGKTQNVTLAKRVPVLLAYWTAWVDDGETVNFRRDVYGRDAKWAEALDQRFSFRKRPLTSGSPVPAK